MLMKQFPRNFRRGLTLAELIMTISIIIILAVIFFINLSSRRNLGEFNGTVRQIAVVLREAQSRAVSGSLDSDWGVRFNGGVIATTTYYALFYGSYSTGTTRDYYAVPKTVAFTLTVPFGETSQDILFKKITGLPETSVSITVYPVSYPASATIITVASSGLVSF